MTLADFYVLAGQETQDQLQFACRLLEKAIANNNSVLLHTDNEQQAKDLDALIWSFRPDAFIPHTILGAADAPADCPISISWQDDPGHHHDIMINLSQEIPPFYSRFQRYIGIVVQHDQVLQHTRKHFRFLSDRGYNIKTHDMRVR